MADDYYEDDGYDYDYSENGFEEYEETTVHQNNGVFFVVCLVLSAVVMFVLMPLLVWCTKRKTRHEKKELKMSMLKKEETEHETAKVNVISSDYQLKQDDETEDEDPYLSPFKKIHVTCGNVTAVDKETKRILNYALPFTLSSFVTALLESVVFMIVGHTVGTKQLAAVAIIEVLWGLVEDFLGGPLDANTTLCAHAVGAGNEFLAGQYVQLSLLFYLVLQIPFICVWYLFTSDILLGLGWADQEEAHYAQLYVKIAIWGVVLDCVQEAFAGLLEVTGHEYYTTIMGILYQGLEVGILLVLILAGVPLSIEIVAWVGVAVSGLFAVLFLGFAFFRGWLAPFSKGVFRNFAIKNGKAVQNMIKTAMPLCFGSVLGNAEWAILTVFASHMGVAEVAAWAILGSIWEIFEATTEGIGDAAEIRVAYHLGNNHPSKAKLSAYKSLYIGMLLSLTVTGIMFLFINKIPEWFTLDETLQHMIGQCLPLIGIGNVVMTFGMLCWYMIGAQGRYKLGTWINFGTSWGITMPLAALSVYVWNFDLQALTSSVLLGYVGVGASLSYVLLTSDWTYRARKIVIQNEEEEKELEEEDDDDDVDNTEGFYAALVGRKSRAARATATGNIKLLTASPGPLGLGIDMLPHRQGPVITTVFLTSPFQGMVFPGDSLLSVDGTNVLSLNKDEIYELMEPKEGMRRKITVMTATPFHYREDGTSEVLLSGTVQDIPDFEEEQMHPSWWDNFGEDHEMT